MKIKVLSQIASELKTSSHKELFGIREKDSIIVSSLECKAGLEKVGEFNPKNDIHDGIVTLTAVDDMLLSDENNEIEIINYLTDFQKRNRGIIEESILQQRVITIIGLGSGGSAIACDLVRCGVTNLIFIDFDEVSLSNLCRSVYDLHDIGRKKTEAIQDKLLKINPCLNLQLYSEDVCEMNQQILKDIIDSSDLIIEATDSNLSKVLINGLAYSSKPVLYPSVYESGKGGDILFTLPGLPCYECVFSSIMNDIADMKKGEWDYTTGQPKPMPALISDIQVIVSRTVKLALAILTGDQENSFLEKVTEPESTMLFISNEKGTFSEATFQEFWAKTVIDPECSCQTLR